VAMDGLQEQVKMQRDPDLSQHLWWGLKAGRSFPDGNGDAAPSHTPELAAELHRMRHDLSKRRNGPPKQLNLNRATIDDLWSVGLTRTQAMRLVAQRARQGDFVSLDELDDLPGFPRGRIASLKQRVTL